MAFLRVVSTEEGIRYEYTSEVASGVSACRDTAKFDGNDDDEEDDDDGLPWCNYFFRSIRARKKRALYLWKTPILRYNLKAQQG
jgi:hypothetical protein